MYAAPVVPASAVAYSVTMLRSSTARYTTAPSERETHGPCPQSPRGARAGAGRPPPVPGGGASCLVFRIRFTFRVSFRHQRVLGSSRLERRCGLRPGGCCLLTADCCAGGTDTVPPPPHTAQCVSNAPYSCTVINAHFNTMLLVTPYTVYFTYSAYTVYFMHILKGLFSASGLWGLWARSVRGVTTHTRRTHRPRVMQL